MCFDSSFLFTLFTPLLACLPSVFSMLWLTSLRPTQRQQGKIVLQSCTACSMSLAWVPSYFGDIFGRPYPHIVPWEKLKVNAVIVWICRKENTDWQRYSMKAGKASSSLCAARSWLWKWALAVPIIIHWQRSFKCFPRRTSVFALVGTVKVAGAYDITCLGKVHEAPTVDNHLAQESGITCYISLGKSTSLKVDLTFQTT